jgi:hypothetical protein
LANGNDERQKFSTYAQTGSSLQEATEGSRLPVELQALLDLILMMEAERKPQVAGGEVETPAWPWQEGYVGPGKVTPHLETKELSELGDLKELLERLTAKSKHHPGFGKPLYEEVTAKLRAGVKEGMPHAAYLLDAGDPSANPKARFRQIIAATEKAIETLESGTSYEALRSGEGFKNARYILETYFGPDSPSLFLRGIGDRIRGEWENLTSSDRGGDVLASLKDSFDVHLTGKTTGGAFDEIRGTRREEYSASLPIQRALDARAEGEVDPDDTSVEAQTRRLNQDIESGALEHQNLLSSVVSPTATPPGDGTGVPEDYQPLSPGQAWGKPWENLRSRVASAREAVRRVARGPSGDPVTYGPLAGEEVLEPGEVSAVDLQAEQDLGLLPVGYEDEPDERKRREAQWGSLGQLINYIEMLDGDLEPGADGGPPNLSPERHGELMNRAGTLIDIATQGVRNPNWIDPGVPEDQREAVYLQQLEAAYEVDLGQISAAERARLFSDAEQLWSDPNQAEFLKPNSPELMRLLAKRLSHETTRRLGFIADARGMDKSRSDAMAARATAENNQLQLDLNREYADSERRVGLEIDRAKLHSEKLLGEQRGLAVHTAKFDARARVKEAIENRTQELTGKTYRKEDQSMFNHDFDFMVNMYIKVSQQSGGMVEPDPEEMVSDFLARVDARVHPGFREKMVQRARQLKERAGFRTQQPAAQQQGQPSFAGGPVRRPVQIPVGGSGVFPMGGAPASPYNRPPPNVNVPVGGQW